MGQPDVRDDDTTPLPDGWLKGSGYWLDCHSKYPWIHPNNETKEKEVIAAQRVLGILRTLQARIKDSAYDTTLDAFRFNDPPQGIYNQPAAKDPELTAIQPTEETIARLEAFIKGRGR